MAKLTINRPDHSSGIYWANKANETYFIRDAATDIGFTAVPGYGISISFLLPGKKTIAYGQLDLKPAQLEAFIAMAKRALENFQPDTVLATDGEGENEG